MDLSARQKATLGAAITVLSAIVILCALAGIFWLIGVFFRRFSSVFLPLAVAGVVALLLKPVYDWILERFRVPGVVALLMVFLVILLPLFGLGWFLGDTLVEQIDEGFEKFPRWRASFMEDVKDRWPRMRALWDRYGERIQEAIEGQEEAILSGLQAVGDKGLSALLGLFGFVGTLLAWAVVPVYVAFFLLINPDLPKNWSEAALPFLKQETREDVNYLVREFVEIVVAFFRGQLLIAFIQGVLYAIGFTLLDLRLGLVLGLMLGFLNIIPYLGSIVGLGVALPLALLQEGGGLWLAASVIGVFTAVQMIEGYLLTPKIMGDQTGLHPMVIMIAIFFWGSALSGITGMILAIPLTAFFVVFWRLLREKYMMELV